MAFSPGRWRTAIGARSYLTVRAAGARGPTTRGTFMKIRTLAAFLLMVAGTVVATLYITGMGRLAHADAPAKAGPIYAQLSSMTTQLPKAGTPLVVQMENNDALSGLTHDNKAKPGEIKVD